MKRRAGLAALAAGIVWMPVSVLGAAPPREGTDMAGRKVALPAQIRRIATLGPVPVLNGFLFAFGEGDKIVNGLPEFARSPRYKFQTRFAPSLANKPMMQGGGREPKLELAERAGNQHELPLATADLIERPVPQLSDSQTIEGGSSYPTIGSRRNGSPAHVRCSSRRDHVENTERKYDCAALGHIGPLHFWIRHQRGPPAI